MERKQKGRKYALSDEAIAWAIRRYDNGNGPSIRNLADACQVSYTTMHTALTRAKVIKRHKGVKAPALVVVK